MKRILLLIALLLLPLSLCAEYYSYTDFSGGLNNKFTNIGIADNEAADLLNIDLSVERGAITKRNGYVCVSTNTVDGSFEINGLFNYIKGDGTNYLVACSSNTIKKLAANGMDWTTLCSTSTIASGSYYDFAVFVDTLIITDGISVPKKWYGGANTEDIQTGVDPDDNRPNFAQFVAVWNNRLFFGGKMQEDNGGVAGDTVYNRVRYSGNIGDPNIFEGAGAWPLDWWFNIDDVAITGMKSFNGALVVFGQNSINEIRGDMTGTEAGTVNGFALHQVMKGVGCIANRTIVPIDNNLYFLDRSGNVYSYDGSAVTLRSDKIAATIKGLSTAQLSKACAEYYPLLHQYWLSVPNGSSSYDNLVLVYDTLLQAWTVYDDINASAIKQVEISKSIYLYTGSSTGGYVYRMDDGDIDYLLNTATGINAYYTTKYFSVPLTEQPKTFDSVYLTVQQSGQYNLTVQSQMDFGKTQNTQLVNLDPGGALWDTMSLDDDSWAGDNTIMIQKLSLSQAANFVNFTFSNSNYSQPFKLYGFGIQINTQQLR